MEKIFNKLFALFAVIAISVQAFAQDTLPAPPLPPENYKLNKEYRSSKKFDKAVFNKKMADFNLKMAGMQKQLFVMNDKIKKQVFVKMKGFDKQFKDFGKDFSGSFNGMAPDVNINLNGFSNDLSAEEYKKQVASGEIIEKIKNYSKTYSVDKDDVLQIANTFGKITVNTWNKNQFKVDVQMKFGSEDEETVNDMINGSSISDSKSGSVVSFKTNLYQGESKRNGNNQHIDINYTVYMPAGNAINIDNKFGSVILPDLTGKATINIQFGNLIAQQLTNTQNDVQIKFTQGNTSNIALFNGGKLKVEHSKLRIGIIDNVNADFDFSNVIIDRLKSSAEVSVKFGNGFNVGIIDKSVKNLNINASFTKINLDLKELQNLNFDVTTNMGSFNYNDDRVKVITKSPADEERGYSPKKIYKGYIGKSSADGNIVINAKFTNVSFN